MEAWRLLWDFRTIRDLARAMPENSPLGNKCLEVGNGENLPSMSLRVELTLLLSAIMNTFKPEDLSTIGKARKLAEKVRGTCAR